MARTTIIYHQTTAPALLAALMLKAHHSKLEALNLFWYFTSETPKTKRQFEHAIKRPGDFWAALSGGRFGAKALFVVFSEDLWNNWSEDQRAAEVDIALSRMEVGKNATMIRSFLDDDARSQIIQRHGAYSQELTRLGKTFAQLHFDLQEEAGTDYTEEETESIVNQIDAEFAASDTSEDVSSVDKLAPADPVVDAGINDALSGRAKRDSKRATRAALLAPPAAN